MTAGNGSDPSSVRVQVAVLDEPEVIRLGVAAMLDLQAKQAFYRWRLVDPGDTQADVVLCDPCGRSATVEQYLAGLAARTAAPLVAFTWDTDPDLVKRILGAGARAWVPKSASAGRLVETLHAAHRGQSRTGYLLSEHPAAGRLSRREREVLALICRGHSNAEIAEALYVSVNSVKTYVRQIYQKTGVTRRAQAVAWGLEHGF